MEGKDVITLPDTSGVGAGPIPGMLGIGPEPGAMYIISSRAIATAVATKTTKQATKIADEYLQAISKNVLNVCCM